MRGLEVKKQRMKDKKQRMKGQIDEHTHSLISRLQFIVSVEEVSSLIMEKVQEIMSNFLLVFQICLATWQVIKLTPVGGLLQGGFQWIISLLPFCQCSDYALLRRCEGRVFKKVNCFVLTKAPGSHDELIPLPSQPSEESSETVLNMSYLGENFRLERRDGNKLLVNEKMCYYITHAMWQTLLLMGEYEGKFVYLKGYKGFWELVVTGGVMKFSEVLDCIILENQYTIMYSDADWLLPVNLSLSEEKVVKMLNLVGFFLQTKKVFWLIPTLLSLASAVLEFNTKLREWVYSNINRLFCCSMHLVCEKLRYSMRRQVYSLGAWVENLKPCNDIQLSVVKGDICAPIAGGAKANNPNATPVPYALIHLPARGTQKTFHCEPIDLVCQYYEVINKCGVDVRYSDHEIAAVEVDCKNREEFMKMCTFLECVARNRSGSLKSYDDGKKKVKVRGWKESVRHYAQSGYPPIYEIRLQNVIVSSL